jgi:hypothetical protein
VGAAGGVGVKEAGGLWAVVEAEAAEGLGGGEPGGADGSGAEEVRELELTENGDEDVGLQIGPVEFGRRWFLHYAGIRFGSTPPPVPYSYPSE